MKRPLFVIGCCYFLSTAAALLFGDNFAAAVGIWTLVSAAAALFLVPPARRMQTVAVLLTAAAALGMGLGYRLLRVRPVLSLADKAVYLEGRVERVDYYDSSARYLLDARIPLKNGKSLSAKIYLYNNTPLPTAVNEELRGYIALYKPKTAGPARYANLSNRIFLSGRLQGTPELLEEGRAARTGGYYAAALRQRLIEQNRRLLAQKPASIVNAVLFGDRSALDEDTQESFKRAGISHLMAVSGFHLSLVTTLAVGFLRAMRVPRRLGSAIALPVMLLFMAVCGFTPSVMRAGLMTGLCLIASMIGDRYDPLSALGFAALLICAVNPYSALSTGFLLSFSASAGILLLSPRINPVFTRLIPEGLRGTKPARMICASAAVSVSAFLATLPLMLFCFDALSLVAPLASMLAVPLATLLLWCALPMLSLSFLPALMPAAKLFAAIVSISARFLADLSRVLAGLPFASVPVRYDFIRVLALLYCAGAAALMALGVSKNTRRLCCALAAAVLAAGLLTAQWTLSGTLRVVTFEGVDAAVIVRGGEAALIGFPATSYAGQTICRFLRSENIRRLDLALSTSADNDDAFGVLDILRAYPPRRLVMAPQGRYTENILALSRGARTGTPSSDSSDRVSALGAQLTLIPCSCGRGCKITAGEAELLKLNASCAIMNKDPQVSGVVRGWVFEDARASSENSGMAAAADGEGTTTYTFRIEREGTET